MRLGRLARLGNSGYRQKDLLLPVPRTLFWIGDG